MTLMKGTVENLVGKGENAVNQDFLLFTQCFPLYHVQSLPFESPFICHLQIWLRAKY